MLLTIETNFSLKIRRSGADSTKERRSKSRLLLTCCFTFHLLDFCCLAPICPISFTRVRLFLGNSLETGRPHLLHSFDVPLVEVVNVDS